MPPLINLFLRDQFSLGVWTCERVDDIAEYVGAASEKTGVHGVNQKFVDRERGGTISAYFSPTPREMFSVVAVLPSRSCFSSRREYFRASFPRGSEDVPFFYVKSTVAPLFSLRGLSFSLFLSAYFASSLLWNTSENPACPHPPWYCEEALSVSAVFAYLVSW